MHLDLHLYEAHLPPVSVPLGSAAGELVMAHALIEDQDFCSSLQSLALEHEITMDHAMALVAHGFVVRSGARHLCLSRAYWPCPPIPPSLSACPAPCVC